MSRFFIPRDAIDGGKAYITNPDDVKHIVKVLRYTQGECVELSDGSEFEYKAEIISLGRDCVELRIIDKQGFSTEPSVEIHLYQGMPKQGKMETIIQKSVELGVNTIIPVFMARSVVTDKGNSLQKAERWQRISDEAVKQCKRGIIPAVLRPVSFDSMLTNLVSYDLVLYPYENEARTTLKDVLANLEGKPKTVALIIGPEGGFSDEEAKRLTETGAASVSLGKTTLRTETAGAAAIAMIMYEFEL